MFKRLREMLRDRRGFTLIELMVVVLIIGILAAIAIPQFTGQAEKAKRGKAIADLKTIGTALEMYYIEENGLPGEPDLEFLVGAGYLRVVPKDPWGNNYSYAPIDGGNPPFELYCVEDEQELYYPGGLGDHQ